MFVVSDSLDLTAALREIEVRQRRLDAERAAVLAEWDRTQAWADDGSVTAASRLARETDIGGQQSRERVRIAQQLRRLPRTGAAVEELGWPKVRLLANSVDERTEEAFLAHEAVLVEHARSLTVDQLAQLLAYWRHLVDADGANADVDSMHDEEFVQLATSWRRQGYLKGRLSPESTAVVRSALDQIAEELFRTERRARVEAHLRGEDAPPLRSASQRNAEALVEMARRSMATTDAVERGERVVPARPTVVVNLDIEQTATSWALASPTGLRCRSTTHSGWRVTQRSQPPSRPTAASRCSSAGPFVTRARPSARRSVRSGPLRVPELRSPVRVVPAAPLRALGARRAHRRRPAPTALCRAPPATPQGPVRDRAKTRRHVRVHATRRHRDRRRQPHDDEAVRGDPRSPPRELSRGARLRRCGSA